MEWAWPACISCEPEVTEGPTLGIRPCGQRDGLVSCSLDGVVATAGLNTLACLSWRQVACSSTCWWLRSC